MVDERDSDDPLSSQPDDNSRREPAPLPRRRDLRNGPPNPGSADRPTEAGTPARPHPDADSEDEREADAATRERPPEPFPFTATEVAPRRRRRGRGCLGAIVAVILVLGIGATVLFVNFEAPIRHVLGWEESNDYTGAGSGSVVVTITDGQVGADVAQTLTAAKVTKTYDAFYGLLLKNPSVTFSPGSYKLRMQMSAASALAALRDPASKVMTRVTIPEGTTLSGVLTRLGTVSGATGVTLEQLKRASTDLASFGIPGVAPSLEGYLFPATYTFDPGVTAHAMLQELVTEMFSRLDTLGVAPTDRHRVLTLAALTQKEGGSAADFPKVAEVWDNRLAQGMNLQSDATVSYGVNGTTLSTTEAQRADTSNKYNTYANPGLPIGPISNPGEDAIKATIAPTPGPWLFFVLINGKTGETVFSTTFAEHQIAVAQFAAWCKANPDFDCG